MLKTLTRCMPGIKLQCDVTRMAHILTKKLQNGISLYIYYLKVLHFIEKKRKLKQYCNDCIIRNIKK